MTPQLTEELQKLERAMTLTSEAIAKLLTAGELIAEIHARAERDGDENVTNLSGTVKASILQSLAAFGEVRVKQ